MIVCPFTKLHPKTKEALNRFAPDAHFVDVSDCPSAYWEVLYEAWWGEEDLIIVEHDIEIHSSVLSTFESCTEPFCSFPYRGGNQGPLERGLGCVRFSTELQRAVPGLPLQFKHCSWMRLDSEVHEFLAEKKFGPHYHRPEVLHHHHYYREKLCACGTEHE